MPTNLRLYHRVLEQLTQWLPKERVTRRRNLALLVAGLFMSRAVHLPLIVRSWPSRSKEPSLVNRLRRFLNNGRVDVRRWYDPFAREVVQSIGGGTQRSPVRLIVDCTKVGFHFRLMMIGVAYRKRTIPLVWSVHRGSKGHTTLAEQLALFRYVRQLLPCQSVVWVMGDTGFQSAPLLQWLRDQGWHFVVRQQGRLLVRQSGNPAWRKINAFGLQPGQTHVVGWVRLTRKYDLGWFWLVLHHGHNEEEPWYLVADSQLPTHVVLRFYRLRMWTEEMYGDMKGHGFDMEATHLDDEARISRLILGVAIAFVWLITLGSWVVKNGLRHFVDHKSRRDKSYFRIGWDWLARCLRLNNPVLLRFSPYP
jgi:hypothetical protein